jgi:hypothetical protein
VVLRTGLAKRSHGAGDDVLVAIVGDDRDALAHGDELLVKGFVLVLGFGDSAADMGIVGGFLLGLSSLAAFGLGGLQFR